MNPVSQNSKIVILRGGPSEEYNLSMQTAADVKEVLTSLGYKTEEITVSKAGEWLHHGMARAPQSILEATDLVFLGLHGAYGEDGTVQRILNRHGVAYTGSGAMASTIAFNKMLAKEHLKGADIKLPKHMRVSAESRTNLSRIANTIDLLFGPSFVIKPVTSGSSIGVRYARSVSELIASVDSLLEIYPEVLVEEFIEGVDVTCAYLEGFRNVQDYVFPPLQLQRSAEDKSLNVFTAEKIFPAQIAKESKEAIEHATKLAHRLLGCEQYSRSDFVVTPAGEVYFLEINTLPALSLQSPFVASAEIVGATPTELISTLLATSHNRKK